MSTSSLVKKSKLKWSLKASFGAFLLILVISFISVFFFRKKPIWYQIEMLSVELILILTLFYSLILYKGINFKGGERVFKLQKFSYGQLSDWATSSNMLDISFFSNLGNEFGGVLGYLLGIIIDFISAFILTLIICFFLWLGLNFIMTGLIFLSSILFYFFERSTSIVIRHQITTEGHLILSIVYGVIYACTYTLIISLMAILIHFLWHYSNI